MFALVQGALRSLRGLIAHCDGAKILFADRERAELRFGTAGTEVDPRLVRGQRLEVIHERLAESALICSVPAAKRELAVLLRWIPLERGDPIHHEMVRLGLRIDVHASLRCGDGRCRCRMRCRCQADECG